MDAQARISALGMWMQNNLYGLTEAEFAHILTTFPLVAEPVKLAASTLTAMLKED